MLKPLSKLGYYQNELEQFRTGNRVSLRRIQLDPVSYCNHDCPFCIYRYDRDEDMNALFDKKDMLPYEKIIEIFDDCQAIGVKAIELTGGGEPSLHPQFPDILSALTARNIDIGLITNGAWRSKHFTAIVRELKNAVWVRFSLDAATPETHQRTHASRKDDFQKAVTAIQALVEHQTVDVGISFVVQQSNYHEIEDAYALAESLGVKYLRLGGVVFEGERIDDIELTPEQYKVAAASVNALKDGKIPLIDNFSKRANVEFEKYNKDDTCYYAHLATVIGADAKMYVCCIWKYRPDGVIADLNQERLKEAWQREAVRPFFESFDIAEKCSRCFLKERNDLIHEMVVANHINFP